MGGDWYDGSGSTGVDIHYVKERCLSGLHTTCHCRGLSRDSRSCRLSIQRTVCVLAKHILWRNLA